MNITEIMSRLNKIKKKYPNTLIVYDGLKPTTNITKLAIGYVQKDVILFEDTSCILTQAEYDSLNDTDNYIPIVIIG